MPSASDLRILELASSIPRRQPARTTETPYRLSIDRAPSVEAEANCLHGSASPKYETRFMPRARDIMAGHRVAEGIKRFVCGRCMLPRTLLRRKLTLSPIVQNMCKGRVSASLGSSWSQHHLFEQAGPGSVSCVKESEHRILETNIGEAEGRKTRLQLSCQASRPLYGVEVLALRRGSTTIPRDAGPQMVNRCMVTGATERYDHAVTNRLPDSGVAEDVQLRLLFT
ncbi:uncharacterized protein EI97DRAFT_446459 [Westerdykella ornata]|uniref:Uncharacterized protein n=1 Tax=Westerdykella ornata TaxID=318751 RepID=A0A6A6J6N1_WESOR|nr:uncharacterized protein EI97DRAFT_446459 [Westerdykella ornata]KAF2271628.1 hypothetical protein EI97DRAFT_446459 [Westerdykella ornata]